MQKVDRARTISVLLILLVLVVGPFFQGLFFPVPLLSAVTIIATAFGLWAYGRRKDRTGLNLPGGWAGGLLLALAGVYLLQSGWASYFRGNLEWLLRAIAAWMAFVITREENTDKTRRWLGWALMITASVVALFGFLEYGAFFEANPGLKDFFNVTGSGVGKRIYSLFQYPNAAAAFMLAIGLIGNNLMQVEESLRRRLGLAALSGIIAVGFFFTLSRGTLVVVPLAVLLLLVGLPRRQILPSLMLMVSSLGVPVLVGMKPIAAAGGSGNWSLVVLWALLSAAAGVAATWGVLQLNRLPARTLWIGLGGLFTAGALGLTLLLLSRPMDQVLPASVARLADINLETDNARNRLDFAEDALRAFQDQPWGYGGTGWDRTYRRYQQAYYVSRETHNHYVQTLVEGGALGLVALVGAIGASLWAAFRSRGDHSLSWTMAVSGSLLALHAMVDFDLSYFHLWLMMWVLLAAGLPPHPHVHARHEKRWIWPSAVAVSLITGLLALDLTIAAHAFREAEYAVLRKDTQAALALSQTAIQLDPWNSQHLRLVSTRNNLEKAVRVDRYNAVLWRDLAGLRMKDNDLAGARAAAQKALENQPMNVQNYVTLAQAIGLILDDALGKGNREQVHALAQDLLDLGGQLEERRIASAERQKRFPYPPLELTPPLQLALGKGLLLTGKLAEAERPLIQALTDKALHGEGSVWLYALYTRQGRIADRQAMKVQPNPESLRLPVYRALLTWK